MHQTSSHEKLRRFFDMRSFLSSLDLLNPIFQKMPIRVRDFVPRDALKFYCVVNRSEVKEEQQRKRIIIYISFTIFFSLAENLFIPLSLSYV